MVALARDELKRCRTALEALATTFDKLLEPNPPGTPELAIDAASGRPAVANAMTLVAFLQAGGRLPVDLAIDLSQELAASRLGRRADPVPNPPA